MSLFNFEEQKSAMEKDDASRSTIPEGKYTGTIKSPEVKTSKAGQQYVNAQIVLDNKRVVFESFHLMHPKAAEIAKQKLTRVLLYGYKTPPAKLETLKDVAFALDGVAVNVQLKHGDTNEKGYVNYKITYLPLTTEQSRADYTVAADSVPAF